LISSSLQGKFITNLTRFLDNQLDTLSGIRNNTMKNRIDYLFSAGRIIQDVVTKKYSFIDVFDTIYKPNKEQPLFQSFYVGGKLNMKAGKASVDVKILEHGGKEIAAVNLAKDQEFVEGVVTISAFFVIVKIEKEGRYDIKISIDDKDLEDDKYYFTVVGEINGK